MPASRSHRGLVILLASLAAACFIYVLLAGGGEDGPGEGDGRGADQETANRPDAAAGTTTTPNQRTALAHQPPADDTPTVTDPREARTLTGKVLGKPTLPIAGATLRLTRGKAFDQPLSLQSMMGPMTRMSPTEAPQAFGLRKEGEFVAETIVQGDGSFVFADVRGRHFRLGLEHDFYGLAGLQPIHLPKEGKAHDLGSLETYLGGLIIGRVDGLRPDERPEVLITAEIDPMAVMQDPDSFFATIMQGGRRTTEVLPDGSFRFQAVWPTPKAQLSTGTADRWAFAGPLRVNPAGSIETVLRLQEGAELTVVVVDDDDAPIADANVSVTPMKLQGDLGRVHRVRRESTDSQGRLTMAGLAPGEVTVAANATNYMKARVTVMLEPSEAFEETVRLGRGISISGIVVDDTGAPVADAGVGMTPRIKVPLMGDVVQTMGADMLASRTQFSPHRTDAEGRFTIGGLAGTEPIHVLAGHKDFVGGLAADVTPGEEDVVVTLSRGGGVVGRLVRAEDGVPIEEAKVRTITTMMVFMRRSTAEEFTTKDSEGQFDLSRVPAGRCTLEVIAEGRGRFTQTITVKPNESLDLGELRIPAEARVIGRVLDPTGAPVRGALVRKRARGFAENPMVARLIDDGPSTKTGEDGSFELVGLPAGRFVLSAQQKGFATGTSERLELAEGATLNRVEIRLQAGGRMEGQILVDPGTDPSAWQIFPNKMPSGAVASGVPDQDGRFVFEGLDAGNYDVQAFPESGYGLLEEHSKKGFEPGQSFDLGTMMEQLNATTLHARVRVPAEGTVQVTLDARDMETAANNLLTVEVRVGGSRLESGWLEVHATEGSDTRFGFLQDGVARLPMPQSDRFRIQVRGGMTMSPIGGPQTVARPSGDSPRIVVELPGGRLGGVVVHGTTGDPLETAAVRLIRADDTASEAQTLGAGFTLTDSDGRFEFKGLADATYTVSAEGGFVVDGSQGGQEVSRIENITVSGNSVRDDLVLHARPGAAASVLVVDSSGNPQPGTIVIAVDKSGLPLSTFGMTATGTDGRAWFGSLPRGEARIVGRAPGFAPGATDLQRLDGPGAHVEFRLVVQDGPATTVQVVDGGGKPIRDVLVSARRPGETWIPATLLVQSVQPNAVFDLGKMAAGTWEFSIVHPRVGEFRVERTIRAGASARLVLTVE